VSVPTQVISQGHESMHLGETNNKQKVDFYLKLNSIAGEGGTLTKNVQKKWNLLKIPLVDRGTLKSNFEVDTSKNAQSLKI
jgi:hypothetical protein